MIQNVAEEKAEYRKASITTFKDLIVWQRAHALVLEVYQVSKAFPSEEKYGLSAQLRGSCTSVAANIVEGQKRRSRRDFSHFLNIAESSLEESKYHLLLSRDLGYLADEEYSRLSTLADEVGWLLYRLKKSL